MRRSVAATDIANYSQYAYLAIVTPNAANPPMYVCLCNALTDRDLAPHVNGGGCSVAMVYRACGCRPQCGKCVAYVRQMLRDGETAGMPPTGERG